MLAAGLLASGARSVFALEVELPAGPGVLARFLLSPNEAIHVVTGIDRKGPGA